MKKTVSPIKTCLNPKRNMETSTPIPILHKSCKFRISQKAVSLLDLVAIPHSLVNLTRWVELQQWNSGLYLLEGIIDLFASHKIRMERRITLPSPPFILEDGHQHCDLRPRAKAECTISTIPARGFEPTCRFALVIYRGNKFNTTGLVREHFWWVLDRGLYYPAN